MKKILICGAGIAGLALARQLKKLNVSFKIIEKRMHLSTEGAGIALPANAVQALRYMGLGDAIDQHAHQVTDVIYTDSTGAVLSQASLLNPPLSNDRFVALHRHKFHELLGEGIKDSIQFGVTIEKLTHTDQGVLVKFNKPELQLEKFDLIVGADGIHSQVRTLAFPQASVVNFGFMVWRWTCKHPTQDLQPTYMIGNNGSVIMFYPISKDEVYCYANILDSQCLKLNPLDHGKILRDQFGQYGGIAKVMLEKLPDNSSIIQGTLTSVARPLFTERCVALIGDAAHGCSPVLQQGAACALEDVIVLSELLQRFSIQQALCHYEKLRSERVNYVVSASDGPIKAQMNATPQIMAGVREKIRDNGPFNILGWKQLLAVNPLAELFEFIAKQKENKISEPEIVMTVQAPKL